MQSITIQNNTDSDMKYLVYNSFSYQYGGYPTLKILKVGAKIDLIGENLGKNVDTIELYNNYWKYEQYKYSKSADMIIENPQNYVLIKSNTMIEGDDSYLVPIDSVVVKDPRANLRAYKDPILKHGGSVSNAQKQIQELIFNCRHKTEYIYSLTKKKWYYNPDFSNPLNFLEIDEKDVPEENFRVVYRFNPKKKAKKSPKKVKKSPKNAKKSPKKAKKSPKKAKKSPKKAKKSL